MENKQSTPTKIVAPKAAEVPASGSSQEGIPADHYDEMQEGIDEQAEKDAAAAEARLYTGPVDGAQAAEDARKKELEERATRQAAEASGG